MTKTNLTLAFLFLGVAAGGSRPASAADLRPGLSVAGLDQSSENETGEAEAFSSVGLPQRPEAQALLDGSLRDLVTPDMDLREGEETSDASLLAGQEEAIKDTLYWLESSQGSADRLAMLSEAFTAEGNTGFGLLSRPRTGRPKLSALTCLAVAIQGEAGGEPDAGKMAVAQTILRRAGGIPGRICAVIFAAHQFESIGRRLPHPSASCLRVALAAIRNHAGRACTFDHFIAKGLQRMLGRKIPAWVRDFERRGCLHKKIGQQDYYASCNCKRPA